jgi:PAS domain S-box-containing protein
MNISNLPKHIVDSLYILRTDINNKIIFVSKAICEISGYTEKELLGKDPRFFRDSKVLKNPTAQLWESLSKTGQWEGILRNKKKNGELYYQSANITKEFDSNGNHIGYFSINTDITDAIQNPSKFIFESSFFDIFFNKCNFNSFY